MRYSKKFGTRFQHTNKKNEKRTASKGLCMGIFCGIGLGQLILAKSPNAETVESLIGTLVGLAFITEAYLILRDFKVSVILGYILSGALSLTAILNFLLNGRSGFGILWLFAVYFGIRQLSEYQRQIQERELDELYDPENQDTNSES